MALNVLQRRIVPGPQRQHGAGQVEQLLQVTAHRIARFVVVAWQLDQQQVSAPPGKFLQPLAHQPRGLHVAKARQRALQLAQLELVQVVARNALQVRRLGQFFPRAALGIFGLL